MLIKVCGMRNPENIEQVAKLKPNLMGFIFYPKSKRYIDKIDPTMINNKLFEKIKKTGVFVNALIGEVFLGVDTYQLDYIQLHGNEAPEYCEEIKSMNMPVIKAFNLDEAFDFSILKDYQPFVEYFLFDTKADNLPGGSGKQFNWGILEKYQLDKPFLLSGGIGPDDAEKVAEVKHPQLAGIDINSKFETEPAMKDVEKVKIFINEIRGIHL